MTWEAKRELFDKEIGPLMLLVRTENCLWAENILTLEQLCAMEDKELMHIPNFGRKSLLDLKDTLARKGLSLGAKPSVIKPVEPGLDAIEQEIRQQIKEIFAKIELPVFKQKITQVEKVIEIPKEKIVMTEKVIEVNKEMPRAKNCIICNKAPRLSWNGGGFSIVCDKCGLIQKSNEVYYDRHEDIFPVLYQAINNWSNLTAHLEIKNDGTSTQSA